MPAGVAPGTVPTDTLFSGCSGGISGGGGGLAVTNRGEVLRWSTSGPGPPKGYTLVRVDSAVAEELFRELERIRFRSIRHNEPSNMTCFLNLTGEHGSHEVAWPWGQPPRAVRPVFERLEVLGAEPRPSPDSSTPQPLPPHPLTGRWRKAGWTLCAPVDALPPGSIDLPIEELEFRDDGEFSVTWQPFEGYRDYWGRYVHSPVKRTLELSIEGGNFIPHNFDGDGEYRLARDTLILRSISLGTRQAPLRPAVCELMFAGLDPGLSEEKVRANLGSQPPAGAAGEPDASAAHGSAGSRRSICST